MHWVVHSEQALYRDPCVTVTGSAALVGDVEEMARYDRVLPRWPGSGGGGQLIQVCPGRVSGYRVVEPGAGWPGRCDGA